MDTTLVVAIVGVLGTLLGSLVTQYLTHRAEWGKWERELADRIFERRRDLYRDFITLGTDYCISLIGGIPDVGTLFTRLSQKNAEIQITCPNAVVDRAGELIKTFGDVATETSDKALFEERWNKKMNDFIAEARRDIEQGPRRLKI